MDFIVVDWEDLESWKNTNKMGLKQGGYGQAPAIPFENKDFVCFPILESKDQPTERGGNNDSDQVPACPIVIKAMTPC